MKAVLVFSSKAAIASRCLLGLGQTSAQPAKKVERLNIKETECTTTVKTLMRSLSSSVAAVRTIELTFFMPLFTSPYFPPQVWFWRFKSDARQKVYKRMEKAKARRKEFDVYDKASAKKFSDAKAELGVWSEAGVAEGRQLFWNSFERGKLFGRRQTFWDGLVRPHDCLFSSRLDHVIECWGMKGNIYLYVSNLSTPGLCAEREAKGFCLRPILGSKGFFFQIIFWRDYTYCWNCAIHAELARHPTQNLALTVRN